MQVLASKLAQPCQQLWKTVIAAINLNPVTIWFPREDLANLSQDHPKLLQREVSILQHRQVPNNCEWPVEKSRCLFRSLMIPKNWNLILLKQRPRMYRKTAITTHLFKLPMACKSTINTEQKAQKKFQGVMPWTGAVREDLPRAQVQESAHFCHRYPPLLRTTTNTTRARL